jgi:6,7-dimethyl-8-ribityllumazine synthase
VRGGEAAGESVVKGVCDGIMKCMMEMAVDIYTGVSTLCGSGVVVRASG